MINQLSFLKFKSLKKFILILPSCIFICCNTYGQGTEDFSNLPTTSSGSYLSRTWTGTDGVTWTAQGARTDQTLNGKAICFGTSGNRWVTSPTYANGMGTLTFNYVRGFTGTTGTRTLQVWVNGTQIGSDITVSNTSDVVVGYSQVINADGNVQLEIRSTGSSQIRLDDIAWNTYTAPPSNCSGQMSGTYTINASAAASCTNYQTFASAISDLISGTRADDYAYRHAGGVNGPVVFNITSATYTEQISISAIPGASSTNTITFKSASGTNTDVTLTNASSSGVSNNYTLQINGADYLRFEDMTIERSGTNTYARVIDFTGDASYNNFDGNRLLGRATSASSLANQCVVGCDNTDAGNVYNSFTNNNIENGNAGIYWSGTSSVRLNNLTVSGNTFSNYRYGVNLNYCTNATVTGNTITVPSSYNSASMEGIATSQLTGMLTVSQNNIVLTSATSNKGINIQSSVGDASNIGNISNNMIVVSGSGTVEGINSGSLTSYKNYYYNSVYNTGSNSTSSSAFYMNGSNNITLRNNVLFGTVGNAIEILTTSGLLSSDYNDLYSTGTYVGYWGGNRTDLSAYQTASSTEANSISADPDFVSATDLHVNAGSPTDASATPISGFTTDIDGETRNTTTPDIGADEYNNAVPNVQLSVSANSGSEAAATVITVTVTASSAVTGNQTVSLGVSGTGITGGDYTLGSSTITILSGATTGTTTFTIVDDVLNEGTETATLAISSPSSGIILGSTITQNITITDNDQPLITTSTNTLSGFTTTQGTASSTQTFTVSGDNLSGNLSMSALTGFEYSLDNSTFTATLTIPVSGGNVTGEPRTVYVRLSGSSQGSFSGNTTISGGGATSVNIALSGTVTAAPCQDIFISEYIEGSSSNKYIEIYNPTNSSINLGTGNYSLRLYTNGSSSTTNDVSLTGTIAAYATIVYANSGATIYGGTSTTNAAVNFNGNDAVALAKNGTNIDIFGRIGNDPGSAWTSGGNTTADKTLVRNASVQVGVDVNPTGTGSGAFTTLGTEWTQYNQDVVANLGSHTCDCFVANPTVNLSINTSTGSESATTSITLTATASSAVSGDQTVEVTLSGSGVTNSDFTGVTFPVNITILNGQTTGSITFSINNDVVAEGDETATFTIGNPSSGVTVGVTASQNLVITDDDNVTSSASVIVQLGGEATTISSLSNGTINNNTEGTQVWQFRLYDGNGSSNDADTKPTIYQQFTIRQSPGNTVPVWNTTIDNVKFFLGSNTSPISGSFLVSATTISFTPTTPISVTDNGFETVSMRMTLDAPLATGSDGQHFGFSITNADVTVDSDVLVSSQLGSFTQTSNALLNEIDITATLQFINAPTTVGLGDAFTITVSAIDVHGNIDQNNTSLITLGQNTGTGTMTGGGSQNLVGGTYTWTGLTYDVEEIFQVIASGGGFSSITANINVVDEDFQLFDHFNRADNSSVGIPSSGGSTAWTETEAGDGTKVQIFNNMLFIDNCISSPPNSSSGGTTTERVSFNVETYYETVFNNADNTLNWLFNMRSNNNDLSGFLTTGSYAMGFILGCDQEDPAASGSDGYAVVVGNSGSTDYIRLIYFTNGLTNANITELVSSALDIDANYASVKVSFNPCDGNWTLYVRDDGSSGFNLPSSSTPAYSGPYTATNTTHTALDLKYFGAVWKHSSSCVGNDTYWDNFYIPNSNTTVANTKTWNGGTANWNTAANWSPCPGVPTTTDNVIIPVTGNNPIISASPAGFCNNLTVNSGAQLTINSGQFLNAHGNVVNNGNTNFGAGTLQLEHTPPATVSVTGNINIGSFFNSNIATLSGTVSVSNEARAETGGTLNANGNLVLNSNAQLFHGAGTTTPCACEGTVNGNIVVKRQGTSSSSRFNAWSTPIVNGVLPGSNGYQYIQANGTHDHSDDQPSDPGWSSFSGTMTQGKGYVSQNGGLATFTGTPGNGTVPFGVTTSANPLNSLAQGSKFNLVGNPYPSAISVASFLAGNTSPSPAKIAGSLYFWDDDNSGGSGYTSSDYSVINSGGSTSGGNGNVSNGYISTGQGFFVEALLNTNISFTNSMRGGTNTQFFKTEEEEVLDRIWLDLYNDELFNEVLVVFSDNATEQRDIMYDAYKLRGNDQIAFFAEQENDAFTIVAFPKQFDNRIVPLGSYVREAGVYTIKAKTIENFNGIDIYLEDRNNATFDLLTEGSTFNFNITPEDEYGRFFIHFSPLSTTISGGVPEPAVLVYNANNNLYIQFSNFIDEKGTLSIMDIAGRTIFSKGDVSTQNGLIGFNLPAVSQGVYLVTFQTNNGKFTNKILLR